MRFVVHASVCRFIQALAIGGESTVPASESAIIDTSDDVGKVQEAAKKRNAMAVADLTMAFTMEGIMSLVCKAMDPNWPGGLVHKVVEALFKKFKPQDTISQVELRQRLNKVSMKKTDDPSVTFEQTSAIENQCNNATTQLSEEDKTVVVLDATPKEHQSVLTTEQRIQGTMLQLTDLETAMNDCWRQVTLGVSTGDSNELTLSAFSGKCCNCKEVGHRANECPKE